MSLQLGNVWEARFHRECGNDATHSALSCDSSWGVTRDVFIGGPAARSGREAYLFASTFSGNLPYPLW